MSYQIIWGNGGVHSRFHGILSPEIHDKAINELFSDPRIDDAKYIIGDYSQIDGSCLDEKDAEYSLAITTGAAHYLKNRKIALVAVNKEVIELCKYYIELSSQFNTSWEIKLFDHIDSAKTWIASHFQHP